VSALPVSTSAATTSTTTTSTTNSSADTTETAVTFPAAEVDAIIRLGSTDAGPPPDGEHDHGHGADHTAAAVDPADAPALEVDLAAASAAIADYDTVEEAFALGYVLATAPSPGIGTHLVHWSQIERPFEPGTPSMLLFDFDRIPPVLVGYSYALQAVSMPDGFAGDTDQWHRHTGLCVRLDGWVVRERAAGRDECDGSYIAGGDFWMLHAWVVPGWENGDGVFAPMNPKLCPPAAGTPDYLRCPDEPQL
jgi:hypothetical protein